MHNLTFSTRLIKWLKYLRLKPFDENTEAGRAAERNRRVLIAALASFLTKAVGFASLAITTPMLLSYLDAEAFGLWMTISSLVVVLAFLDFGVGNGLVSVVADANGRNDYLLAQRAITSAVTFLTLIAICIAIGILVLRSSLDWQALLKIQNQTLVLEAKEAICILLLCLAISLPFQSAQRVQIGYQEGLQANVWQFFSAVCTFCTLTAIILARASLLWLVISIALTPVIVTVANFAHQFFVVRPRLRPNRAALDWSMSRHLISLGALWTWSQLAGFVGTAADNLIITAFLGPSAVGPYAVMARLQSALMIAQLLAMPLWPAFAEAIQRGDIKWAKIAFRRAIVLFTGIGLINALILSVGSFFLIPLWLGAEMLPSIGMAIGFGVWAIITNFFSAISAVLANQHSLKLLTKLTTLAAAIAICLKLLLIETIGVTAVIWGSVIGYGLICVPSLFFANRILMLKNDEV